MGKRKKRTFYEQFLNKRLDVLFEEEKHGKWLGLTGNYIRVSVKSDKNLKNQLAMVKLVDIDNDCMVGELV